VGHRDHDQLAAAHAHDFDPVGAGNIVLVVTFALVAEHDTGRDGQEVRSVVPLFALGGPNVFVGLEQRDLLRSRARRRSSATGRCSRSRSAAPDPSPAVTVHDRRCSSR